ncbi:M20 family peptidase, partial [bacterium]
HLDVVPVGSSWTKEPFGGQIEDDYLYSRGATDDKGPTMAAFWAMRAIKECCPDLPSRMRMGFGCDEESGFGCVERYVKTEEAPTFGITPDSGWPCYNAEKGICDLMVTLTAPEGEVRLVSLRGGSRPNIVIDGCTATVRVASSIRANVEGILGRYFDRNLTTSWEGDDLKIEAVGQAAHGSRPFAGDSAAVRIFRLLYAISPPETLEFYEDLLGTAHPAGEGLGIHGMDPVTGLLSSNLGIVDGENGSLRLLFNVRYNVDTDGESLRERAAAKLAPLGGTVEIERDSPPLYFPADSALVQTIVDVYEAETGERKAPGSMGGGTYARAVPNTISIGTHWIGDGDAHGPDERIKVEHLLKIAKIYAHILYRLATIP